MFNNSVSLIHKTSTWEQQDQISPKISVSSRILEDALVGSLFPTKNLTEYLYLKILQDTINPIITQIVEFPLISVKIKLSQI